MISQTCSAKVDLKLKQFFDVHSSVCQTGGQTDPYTLSHVQSLHGVEYTLCFLILGIGITITYKILLIGSVTPLTYGTIA